MNHGAKPMSDLDLRVKSNMEKIKHKIVVMSGKGGVGKSTMSTNIAYGLAMKGYKVGIVDADIHGPNIALMLGQEGYKMPTFEPLSLLDGNLKVVSLSFFLPTSDDPVIWRGPMVTGVLNQMFKDTDWEELDYLLIDMPPGTSDITLTVMQTFPIKELVIVSTPQDMVSMIVKKLVTMAHKMNVCVRGVVENMAYIECECGKKMRVFSKKSSEEHAEYLGLPLIGELPINLDLTEALENGKAEEYVAENPLYSLIFEGLY